jgi:hypothetical protein
MLDTQIHVAIKSYKRAGRVKTLAVAPFAYVWVPESQGDAYREHYGDRVVTIPDERDGNLCRKNNAILDLTPCPWTLILDDDIPRIGYWEDGGHHWLEPDELWEVVVQGFVLAHDFGVRLWGVQQNKDELGHDTFQPLNLLAPVLGPFNGHLEPVLRYDESVLGKDDYDFWLQNIRVHRMTLRFNKYHYVHDHGKSAGGFVGMRTKAVEEAGVARMRQKWGKLFKPGGSAGGRLATGKNILNSRVRVPLSGC